MEQGHESEDALEQYALGRLPVSEIERIEEHLFVCESCCERLDETAAFARGMRDVLADELPAPVRTPLFGWLQPRMAFAGAFAVLLIGLAIYFAPIHTALPAAASLELTALRGSDNPTVQRAARTDFTFDDSAPGSRIEIVDAKGRTVWTGTADNSSEKAHARLDEPLPAGSYFVRTYAVSGGLEHEYPFHVAR
jgi:anti-sigma factor RsiW